MNEMVNFRTEVEVEKGQKIEFFIKAEIHFCEASEEQIRSPQKHIPSQIEHDFMREKCKKVSEKIFKINFALDAQYWGL